MHDDPTTEHDTDSAVAVIEAEHFLVPLTAIEVYQGDDAEQLHGHRVEDQPFYPPSDGRFDGRTYLPAPELAKFASGLITKHERFSHLRPLHIDYLWKRKGSKRSGVLVRGGCRLASDLIGYYADVTFVVYLAADVIREHRFTARQVEAAVHHELLHAGAHPETNAPCLWAHDFEGFDLELAEYGVWTVGVAPQPGARQMPLFADATDPDDEDGEE